MHKTYGKQYTINMPFSLTHLLHILHAYHIHNLLVLFGLHIEGTRQKSPVMYILSTLKCIQKQFDTPLYPCIQFKMQQSCENVFIITQLFVLLNLLNYYFVQKLGLTDTSTYNITWLFLAACPYVGLLCYMGGPYDLYLDRCIVIY